MPATPKHSTPDTTQSWDGPGQVKNLEPPLTKTTGNKVYAWRDPDKDLTTKAAWKCPHHQVNADGDPGDANVKGCQTVISVLNGGMGGADIPEGDVQGVYDHVAKHLKDADVEPAPLKRSDDPEGEARGHDKHDGTHSHAHPAFDSQGGDASHDHEHTHSDDASHDHAHDRSASVTGDSTRAKPDANDVPDEIGDGDDDADDAGTVPCPSCLTMNPASLDECTSCGGELPPDASVLPGDGRGMDAVIDDDSAGDMGSVPIDPLTAFNSRDDVAVIRSRIGQGINLRDDSANGGGTTLYGYFSTFNELYEIDSIFEGRFLEQVAPGAYKQTLKQDAKNMRCLFDHGFDPQLGNKPLGPFTVLREDSTGGYYEVPLLDAAYNHDFVLPALQGRLMNGQMVGSQLGASMRFIVLAEEWDRTGKKSKTNPGGLPVRTITQAQVLELGPVTFPANQGASAGVRSGTDDFIDHLHHDQRFVARLTAALLGPVVVERMLDTMRWDPGMARNGSTTDKRRADGSSTRSLAQRRALLALHDL